MRAMLLTPLILALAATQAPATTPPAPAYSPRRGGRLFISPRGEPFRPSSREDDSLADWFQQANLVKLVPDVMERDVFICGPHGMTRQLVHTLRALGMAPDRIHTEAFDF